MFSGAAARPPSIHALHPVGVWPKGCLQFFLQLRLLMFPKQSTPVLIQGMPAALHLLPQLPHLSETSEAAISSVVWLWAEPCETGLHSPVARPLCWIRGKCVSKAELLRKHQTESAGGTGRESCCEGACPAGQMDNVKSLDRRASHDQTEQNYL